MTRPIVMLGQAGGQTAAVLAALRAAPDTWVAGYMVNPVAEWPGIVANQATGREPRPLPAGTMTRQQRRHIARKGHS